MAENIKVGYVRVSTKEQNETRQIKEMKNQGIDDRYIFIDKKSGKDFDREKYKAMYNILREGDTVFISSLDRLGRNYTEIGEEWGKITQKKKANMVVLDMPILDTRKNNDLTGQLISDIVFKLLSYVAENERRKIHERQAAGIAIAKAEGKYKGRQPVKVDKEKFRKLYEEVQSGDRTNRSVMRNLGLNHGTYYNIVNEYKTQTGRFAES